MKRTWKFWIIGLYSIGMLWLLFGQRMLGGFDTGLQLRPFYTLNLFWNALCNSQDPGLRWQAMVNLVGNVAMFVPLGCLVPWIWAAQRCFWRQFLLMVTVIIFVEVIQLLTGLGWCDVDDLILNIIGTSIGFCLWKALSKTRWA